MLQTLDAGERSLAGGTDGGSVAFALRCRCLRARSGPADGWCRGRGRRCRSVPTVPAVPPRTATAAHASGQHGNSGNASGQHGNSGNASGQHGNSGNASGQHGNSGNASGQHGNGGNASGQQPSTAANSPSNEPGGTDTTDETNDSGIVAAAPAVAGPMGARGGGPGSRGGAGSRCGGAGF